MRYRRTSRFRRVAKWAGLGVCVFLTATWAVSTIFWFQVTRPIIPRIQLGTSDSYLNDKKIATGPPIFLCRYDRLFRGRITINGFDAMSNIGWWFSGPIAPILSLHHLGFVLPHSGQNPVVPGKPARLTVTVPMWLPLVVFAIPTAYFWYRDRRTAKPGNCLTCGYNLTGNESGKCPECSTPVPKQETTA